MDKISPAALNTHHTSQPTALGSQPMRQDNTSIVPAQLAHIVLRTAQYETVIDWYTTLLNASISFGNRRITFLTYDKEHHRIAIAAMPLLGKRKKSHAGVDHIAFTYASLSDLLENYARLHDKGVLPEWAINHGPTTSMYYEDPDGNFIELQVDNFDTLDDLASWMETGEFEENPIGVNFDPADLLERLRNGEPEENLKRRPNIGPQSGNLAPKSYLGGWINFLVKAASLFGIKP